VTAPFVIGNFLIPVVLVLALYWFLVRFKVEPRDRPAVATILMALALTLAGEFAVYVALPGDIQWQVHTSIDRLLLQLWPSGMLAFFLAANQLQLAPKLKAPAKTAEKGKRAPKASRA
jgi:tellurite resistance protein TehA-like permease